MKKPPKEPAHNYLPDIHRLLPQSSDAEQGVLSSILLSPSEVLEKCAEQTITEYHFHVPAHGTIYHVLRDIHEARKKIDVITLTQELRDRKILDQVGGPAFITDLFTFLPTAANATFYLEILDEKYTLREIIRVCTEYAARSYDEHTEVTELLDKAEEEICKISRQRYQADADYVSSKDAVMAAIHKLEERHYNKGLIGGIPTGFTQYDKLTDGLQNGELTVIAARPSMGKTALAMNMAEHIAIDLKIPVGIFSLEMSRSQLMQRTILGRARVNWLQFRDGWANERDFPAITQAASSIASAPIHINDKSAIPVSYVRAVTRSWVKKYGIKVAFVDYLQLLKGSKQYKGDNRQLEVADISGGLKALAKELNIPIVVLAQLSRKPDDRTGFGRGKPRLSDIRESGAIEQDADVIGLLSREEMYAEDDDEKRESEGKAVLNIAKQRNGPTGDVLLTFIKEYTRFENRASVDAEEPELVLMPPPPKKKKPYPSYHH